MAIPLVTLRDSLVVRWPDTQRNYQFHINNFIYSPFKTKYRNQIQLSEYISCTRGLTYLRGGSRVSISSRISSQDLEESRMSTFSHLSSWNFESGFQVMLRICLVFPVKFSSHHSPVFAVPAMEAYWTRASQAQTQEILSLKLITTKERDDSMVNFRQYIWSTYLAFLFVFNETETLTIFKDETNEN